MTNQISHMRCEYQTCPLGVDATAPHLSWVYQTDKTGEAQIRVQASTSETFSSLLWDSGWIDNRQTALDYAGEALSSNQRLWWKAMTRLKDQPQTLAEAVNWFETGLLREDDWHGHWIRADFSEEAPVMIRSFSLDKLPERARIYLCGLGYFELCVNGTPVGDEVLQPIWTAYSAQPLTHMLYPYRYEGAFRTPYRAFSLDGLLKCGVNTVEVKLGNGWYHQNRRLVEGDLWYGESPVLQLEMRLDEQIFSSDELWQWHPGETVRNNIFYGEEIDRTRDQTTLHPVFRAEAPRGALTAQLCPSDAPLTEYLPQRALETGDGKLIIDFGQNLSGWVEVTAQARRGDRLEMRFAEEITQSDERWHLDYGSSGGEKQIQQDVFVFAGDATETIHPHFCWHGYRYAEVTLKRGDETAPLRLEGQKLTALDFKADLKSVLVAANHPQRGQFSCDDETLNWFHQATLMSMRSNQHGGVPLDCPHRERLGYTGDGQITAAATLMNLEADAFLRKWMRDIMDAQNRRTGHVPHTAPFYNGGGGPGGWGGAIVFVPWELYRFTGDAGILREAWPHMLSWMDYLRSRSEDGLVVREEEGGWCLGDWDPPAAVKIETELVNTALTIRMLEEMSQMARILGSEDEARTLDQERLARIEAFRRHFYHPETAGFGAQCQGTEAFALWCGAVLEEEKPRVFQKIIQDIHARGDHFDTGIFGTPVLLDVLSRLGEADTALRLMTSQGDPSFHFMRERGATTLYEHWRDGSHNHIMFGSVDTWLYEWAAGLAQADGSVGWQEITLRPGAVSGLNRAEASIMTPLGLCALSWQRSQGALLVKAQIPSLAHARLVLPGGKSFSVEPGKHEWRFDLPKADA